MGYREIILAQDPLAFWPLDDQASSGIAKEASGSGNDGSYVGAIFDEAMPLVSNGLYGTRLLDSTAEIYYPCPGATGSGTSWSNGSMWSAGKESQTFSVELYFKLNENASYLTNEVVLFGNRTIVQSSSMSQYQTYTDIIEDFATYTAVLDAFQTYDQILNASIFAPYGIYLYKNKIYFRPDPEVNYYVSYQVPDWKRRYHVVANYSQGGISLIVNGENVVSNTTDSLDTDFEFSLTNSVFKTIGDDDYKLTVDAIALYKYNISQTRAQDHLDLSRRTVVKRNYFNSNNQLFYSPNNSECMKAYSFMNNWTNFNFTNAIVNEKNNVTLKYISDQTLSGTGSAVYSTNSSRTGLSLGSDQYLDISQIVALIERGTAISMSFYHSTVSPQRGLLSLENSESSQSLFAWINSSNKLTINYNGSATVSATDPTAGWNEILVENKTGDLKVYLNGTSIFSSTTSFNNITLAHIGRTNTLYAQCPITWVAIKSDINYNGIVSHVLYNQPSDYILKLQNNLSWSQHASVNGSIYVPAALYEGSLAFYTGSSQNLSVTYNNGLTWPKMGILPQITSSSVNTVTDYEITISLSTDNSETDLPILTNIGLYAYSDSMKRVIPENGEDLAQIMNIDQSIIFDDDVEVLDRIDQAGIWLNGTSYLKIPSQSKHSDLNGFDGTKSITMILKINEPLTSGKYILESGSKSLYWDGTAWQYPGFSSMYVNGQSTFDNKAMIDDWVHISLTSTSKINAGDYIYVGSDDAGANQLNITLGAFSMASYVLDPSDVENEYEMFVGYPQEELFTDTVSLNSIDIGLIPYQVAWQTA